MADPFSKGGPCVLVAADSTADFTADSVGDGGVTTVDHSVTHADEIDTDDFSKDIVSKAKLVAGDNCRHPVSNMSAGSEDNQRFDDSSDDEPVGLCDSSSDEELTDLSDYDGDDIVNFVDWRKDGWASLRIGSRGDKDKMLRRRKIKPHQLPELLARRDRLKKENESAEMNMHESKIVKTAELKEKEIALSRILIRGRLPTICQIWV